MDMQMNTASLSLFLFVSKPLHTLVIFPYFQSPLRTPLRNSGQRSLPQEAIPDRRNALEAHISDESLTSMLLLDKCPS